MPASRSVTGEKRENWKKAGVRISHRELPDNINKEKEFRLPFAHVVDRDKYDAVGDTAKIRIPVIFLAGELDTDVPPEDVKEMFDNANESKKFILLNGIGHDYRFNPAEIEMVNNEILKAIPH
jgi:pimeloyl-ACP methyl ester carboxylesterase